MTINPKVMGTSADPEADEYAKPNPQVNPRNIALAEISKTVSDQHVTAAAETADTIDDEGNISPAKPTPPPAELPLDEGETPPAEAAGDTPPPVDVTPPADPALAATELIDPTKEYEVTVDGQKMKVPGRAIIDAGYRTFQKETAADFRLQMASNLLREAETKARGAPPQAPSPQAAAPTEKTDAELANALQFGTPEQAAEALGLLRGRGSITAEQAQQATNFQARQAAQDELHFQDAMKFVQTEYADLLSNDYLKRLFFVEENRRRAPRERGGEADTRPYKDLYKAIGDDLRTNLKLPKPAASLSAAPTPPGTVAARQERKAETPSVPRTAATRLSEAAAAEKAKTPSEIIAGMAAARGKAQLTNYRKGT